VLLHKSKTFLQAAYGIPFDVYHDMVRGTSYFEEIEIWGAFSGPKQPPNPEQKSHPIRRNPASVPEQNSHRPFVGLG
jgi:hypothetical protein